jgi:hypothetical protein
MSSKKNVTLESGRKVKLKEMSIDDIDFCTDITTIVYDEQGGLSTVKGISKARTAWLRRGIEGGDFKNFSSNGSVVGDGTLKELSEAEKNELMQLVQSYQNMGE